MIEVTKQEATDINDPEDFVIADAINEYRTNVLGGGGNNYSLVICLSRTFCVMAREVA